MEWGNEVISCNSDVSLKCQLTKSIKFTVGNSSDSVSVCAMSTLRAYYGVGVYELIGFASETSKMSQKEPDWGREICHDER